MMTLKEWRDLKGLTNADLAKHLGIPLNTVVNYVYGHRKPSLERAHLIAQKTKNAVPPASFIGGE